MQYAIDAIKSGDSVKSSLVFVSIDEQGNPIEGGDQVSNSLPSGDVCGVYHPDGKEASLIWFSKNQDRIHRFLESISSREIKNEHKNI